MFSSALKSFTSNIASNYTISAQPTSSSGPWRIFDGKKKSTGKAASIFVFDRKALESHGNSSLGRSGATSMKRATEEVVERLKKEASSLARLRHPNILELVEPVEETRAGGLQFATEPVSTSLAGLLADKDEQERAGGVGGRSSRYVTEDADGSRKRRDLDIDELEIQKGLLQIGKALEFLHDNAGLVHGNLTPEAIFINSKADWKISGLGFLSPPDSSSSTTSVAPINLSEVLNIDPRLPRSVQINLDWTSPDFVLDNNLNVGADMFTLGLLIISLYNSPHQSPLQANGSLSNYKRLFTSSSTIPSTSNRFLCSQAIPKELTQSVLPRLITRRPAQRMTAKEFQTSPYFDNILISTIRFLDALPGKTAYEKSQFMKGLSKVLPSFPKSVLDKKFLPALVEEMKDRDLLSTVLQNIFKVVEILPSAQRSLSEKILPKLKEIFVASGGKPSDRDTRKEAGLLVVLENLKIIAANCSGQEFKEDMLPIMQLAIESPIHSLVDAALRCLPTVLPILDFLTIKNELFPIVANVFSKTSSLGIKVRGLEAFVVLCGGSLDSAQNGDGLSGISPVTRPTTASALDKHTMQERVVPLIRVIKTKEPAVAMAALNVLRHVGGAADTDFTAMHILPILWNMALGPLLDLQQFQSFMEVIKSLGSRVEAEQIKKLQELGSDPARSGKPQDFMAFEGPSSRNGASSGNVELDFESLVKGTSASHAPDAQDPWNLDAPVRPHAPTSNGNPQPMAATFAWSTQNASAPAWSGAAPKAEQAASRTITPDLSRFEALAPSSTQFSQPLQPHINNNTMAFSQPLQPHTHQSNPFSPQPQISYAPALQPSTSINWGAASMTNNTWSTGQPSTPGMNGMANSLASMSLNNQMRSPPAPASFGGAANFSLPPPPNSNSSMFPASQPQRGNTSSAFGNPAPPKAGLDAFESLL